MIAHFIEDEDTPLRVLKDLSELRILEELDKLQGSERIKKAHELYSAGKITAKTLVYIITTVSK
ncbi:MAG: hypothetical protein AB1330_01065 [Bacillota bacterium]